MNNPTYFIFSDDEVYIKKYFKNYTNIVIVSNGGFTAIEEFKLMSEAKNNIISISTFSWWTAWINLNKNKIVIATTFNDFFVCV